MKVIRNILLAFVIICISLMIVHFSLEDGDGWQLDSWIEFKKDIANDHDFIQEIRIYGNSPNLYIAFITDNELNLEEIKSVFEKVKIFLFNEKVFPELVEYHHKLRDGTTISICIEFKSPTKDGPYYYSFCSHSETSGIPKYDSFKTWYIRGDNLEESIFNE